jgi:phage tail sheath protein FI
MRVQLFLIMSKNRRHVIWNVALSIVLVCSVFAGCGSSSGTSDSSSSSSTAKSLGDCAASSVYHEQQFKDNSSLKATFDDIAVNHLETTANNDVIRYTVTDGPRTFTVTLGSSAVSSAVLKDSSDSIVLSMSKGDAATEVTLQDGSYTLTLTSDGSDTDLISIVPESCMSSAASSNVSVTQSLSKAVSSTKPGVYIVEIPNATTIASQSTHITAMVGVAAKGVVNTPTLVTSLNAYTQTFGAVSNLNTFSMAVSQFFNNGGQTLYVINAASDSVADITTALGYLANITLYNILVVPDLANMTQSDAVSVIGTALPIAYGDNAMMIVDYPTSIVTTTAITAFATQVVNASPTAATNAAIYFPSITVQSSGGSGSAFIGSGSSVAGIYATADLNVGVWQSPAGVVNGKLQGVKSLPVTLNDNTMNELTQSGINPIQNQVNNGIVVWGARTLSQDANYKYISVRRTVLAIKQGIEQGIYWAVFESNTSLTWGAIINSVSAYLTTAWQEGALFGATASDAYTVECGLGSTMTAQNILDGTIVVQVRLLVGGASEYVSFQIVLQLQNS